MRTSGSSPFFGGMGALSSDATGEVHMLEDWLAYNLFRTEGGDLFVVPSCSSSPPRSMCSWQRSCEEALSRWQGDSPTGVLSLQVFVVQWPRAGSHMFIEASQFYKLLNLRSYKGESSKWCYESSGSWVRMLAVLGMRDQVLKSTAGTATAEAMTDPSRFLPRTAVSVRGVFALLLWWATSTAQGGGFRDAGSRARALQLTLTMVQALCSSQGGMGEFTIVVDFMSSWECVDPRPPKNQNVLDFPVSDDGVVCVESWRGDVVSGDLCSKCPKMLW